MNRYFVYVKLKSYYNGQYDIFHNDYTFVLFIYLLLLVILLLETNRILYYHSSIWFHVW